MLALGRLVPKFWSEIAATRSGADAAVYATGRECGLALGRAAGTDDAVSREILRLGGAAIFGSCLLAAWRMTQGVYRVDPTLYRDLVTTEIKGELPSAALERLPEWCLYIEMPGQRFHGAEMHGAWVALDTTDDGSRLLSVGPDVGDSNLALHIDVHTIRILGTLEQVVERALSPRESAIAAEVRAMLQPVINILLYICHTADITGSRGGAPGNPTPVRTRRAGTKIFPVDGLREWDVGVRMGAALRRAYESESVDAGGAHASPRPHIRRAHWHGFRSGPRLRADGSEIPAAERRFDLRWLPPIAVNLEMGDEIPAVVRRIQ